MSSSSSDGGYRASPDPLRTLAQEMQQEYDQLARSRGNRDQPTSQYATSFRSHPNQSPPRGFTLERGIQDQREATSRYDSGRGSSAFGEFDAQFRKEFAQPVPSESQFQNAELRALSESMRSINMPAGGGNERDMPPPHLHQSIGSDYCPVCDQEEQSMSHTQRRHHELHQPAHREAPRGFEQYRSASPAREIPAYASSSHHHPHQFHHPPPTASPLASPFTTPSLTGFGTSSTADEALLYSTQPSRAVLSALRSLQDKLQELRVEKAGAENALAKLEQDFASREYEMSKRVESASREASARIAELEAQHAAKLKEAREKEERLAQVNHKLEQEVRMLKDQSLAREQDIKNLRDEQHTLRLKVNDAELGLAKAQSEAGAVRREVELEHSLATEKDLEIQRLKNEVNKLAEMLHQAQAQLNAAHVSLSFEHESRAREETRDLEDKDTIERLSKDLKIVSKDLLAERGQKQALLNYKYLTRDYISSLLNLNYELSIDAGMSVRKRNDLLKHASDLLQGLKKQAWALETDLLDQANHLADVNGVDGGAGADDSPRSPQKTMILNGVHTQIDEQKYLLAGASSPEAIRVLHPDSDRRGNGRGGFHGGDSDSEDDSRADSPVRQSHAIRVPTTPTVASTNKAANPLKRRAEATKKSTANCHTLAQQKEIALPYTIGRSTKQSFSVPVNVQEILSKQPAYYSKVASKQLAQTRRRSSSGTGSHLPGPVEEERIIVQPPVPAPSISGVSSSNGSQLQPPEPVSLAAHSVGLSTVIQHLESEIETLNRDYIHHLDNTRRDGEVDKQLLQKRLQSILKAIETKNKQVQLLKQHQESVLGNHGVRLYSASTSASRNSRSASQKKITAQSNGRSSRPTTAGGAKRAASTKKRAVVPSSTDLTDRHAHHRHGTQAATTPTRRAYEDDDVSVPHLAYASPNSQRLLEKKIHSMRLLSNFKEMFEGGQGEGEAAKRFGSD